MRNTTGPLLGCALAGLVGTFAAVTVLADTASPPHAGGHDHSQHRAMLAQSEQSAFRRSLGEYRLPSVSLLDQSGAAVPVTELDSADAALAVNFIFATCTTICPVMTATFAQMRRELGEDAERLRMVSITIDPEHDTPDVLADYAERFHAPPEWRFLTGHPEDVEQVLRAFDAWTGAKTNHKPVTLLRRRGSEHWVRLEGLGSGVALATQARAVLD